jgi:hypothetical protein
MRDIPLRATKVIIFLLLGKFYIIGEVITKVLEGYIIENEKVIILEKGIAIVMIDIE